MAVQPSTVLGLSAAEYLEASQERQIAAWGVGGAAKLQHATVAIAGLGGAGGLCTELLARAGVGRFRLLDGDTYALAYLSGPCLGTAATIGRPRVEVAAERILELNPFATVEKALDCAAADWSVEELCLGSNLTVVATPDEEARALICATARAGHVPVLEVDVESPTAGSACLMDYSDQNAPDPDRLVGIRALDSALWRLARGSGGIWLDVPEDNREPRPGAPAHVEPTASIGYVTSTLASLAAAEAIKFVSGYGKPVRCPDEVHIDLAQLGLLVRKRRSSKAFWSLLGKRMGVKG